MTLKVMFGAVSALMIAAPAHAEMNATEARLFELVKSKPAFWPLMPRGKAVQSLNFKGSMTPGLLDYDQSPENFQSETIALAQDVVRNCAQDIPVTYISELSGNYGSSTSWEVRTDLEISAEVSVEAQIPLIGSASATAGVALTVGSSRGTTKTTGRGFNKQAIVALPPNTEADVQIQVEEQTLEGMPFSLEMEMRGVAEILHPPKQAWTYYNGSGKLPANKVKGGSERLRSGNWRDLYICRQGKHAGKIIGKVCNWTFGGEERVAKRFHVLTVTGFEQTWRSKKNFRNDYSDRTVAEGRAPVYYSGQESRPGKRYNGQNFVCRAKHKGGLHPGKVVINHCMIGYAGREIKKSAFDVLIRGEGKDETTPIDLTALLSPEERTFTVDGVFSDTRSFNAAVLQGNPRPVDRRFCGFVPEPVAQSAITEVSVEAPLTITTNTGGRIPTARNFEAASLPAAPVAQRPVITPIEGETLMTIDFSDSDAPKVTLISRLLSDRSPDMFGSDVAAVQQALVERGADIVVDGFFGPETAAALRNFQRENGLPVDGRFGRQTRQAMGF